MTDHVSCDCSDHGGADGASLGTSRRDFMRMAMAGSMGLFAAGGLDMALAWGGEGTRSNAPKGKAKNLIVLWMAGGPSQQDTWDPKPNHKNGGPVKVIPTTLDGVFLPEYMPNLAKAAGQLAIIRSMSSKEGNHDRARYLLHTGYAPGGAVKHPSLGSMISKELGDPESPIPNYVGVVGASHGSGFLGVGHAPLIVQKPSQPLDDLNPPEGVSARRYKRRLDLAKAFSGQFGKSRGDAEEVKERTLINERAVRLMQSPLVKAFDISQEKERRRQAYGDTKFGQGCLLAARLVETGVRCVEVTLGGWDTHTDNFNRVKTNCETFDPVFATLMKDLEQRGLLDSTLILWSGEFGRTPRINGNEGRDHFPKAYSCVMAGGPVRTGQVIGATSPDGMTVAERPVSVPDLMATIQERMGIDYEKVYMSPNGRPLQLSNKGNPIKELVS